MRTLRELREAAGLTQLDIATQLAVTPGTVYNWERGRGEPRARQLRQLTHILGVSAEELLAAVAGEATRTPEGKVAA